MHERLVYVCWIMYCARPKRRQAHLGAMQCMTRAAKKNDADLEKVGIVVCYMSDVNSKERATGLEPATSSLGSWHSTN